MTEVRIDRSEYDELVHDFNRFTQSEAAETDFIPPGGQLIVKSHQLDGGMIYVGRLGRIRHPDIPRSCIDLDAKVATAQEDIFGYDIDEQMSYHEMSMRSRLAYLRWLAGGRRDVEYGIGYVFLFFHGLEWRLFRDEAYGDAPAIIQEVVELRKIYGQNRFFDKCSQDFLDIAELIQYPETREITYQAMVKPPRSRRFPPRLRAAIGAAIKEKGVIGADLALDWWVVRYDGPLPATAQQVFPELRLVFRARFNAKYPDGLSFNPPKILIRDRYQLVSGDFSVGIYTDLPDVRNLTAPREKIHALVEDCLEGLKNYAAAKPSTKTKGERASLMALGQLPPDMRAVIPSKSADDARAWLKRTVTAHFAFVAVAEACKKTGIDSYGKLISAKLRKLAMVLRFVGYDIVPHPDFDGKCGDGQKIVIFHDDAAGEAVASPAYLSAAHALSLSVAVAWAGGAISAQRKTHLRKTVKLEGKGLSASEQRRLSARLEWLMAYPPTWALLQVEFKKLPVRQRRVMARFALAVVAVGGHVGPGQIKLLGKLYALLEVGEGQLHTDLYGLMAGSLDMPVSVRVAGIETGYTVPTSQEPAPTLDQAAALDMSRLEQVRRDTHHVSQILSELFADADAGAIVATEVSVPGGEGEDGRLVGLDADHRLLLGALLTREHWPRGDYERLCSEFGLMAEGALATINDWAFDAYDDVIVEDGETLVIHKELL